MKVYISNCTNGGHGAYFGYISKRSKISVPIFSFQGIFICKNGYYTGLIIKLYKLNFEIDWIFREKKCLLHKNTNITKVWYEI